MSSYLASLRDHGHHITVTPMQCGRAHTECTCTDLRLAVHASTRAAERAALRHYLDHAPDGAGRVRAQQLLDQITTSTTTGTTTEGEPA